jgi:tRNA modification GTPase
MGVGAQGIIRVSGSDARKRVQDLFRPDPGQPDMATPKGWLWIKGRVVLEDSVSVPADCYLFNAPRSYTTEDLIELHLPGSPPMLQMVLDLLLAGGVRMAEPGEFTARAFLNGRLDLSEAEAVAQLINARSDAQLRAAERLVEGELHKTCKAISQQLAEMLALVEADIDFSDEDIELARVEELDGRLATLIDDLARLVRESVSWETLERLPQVVLAGLANAGKSTLVNRLLDSERAITSSTAGTTRDVLTAPLQLAQGECLLVDTAGLGPVEDQLADQTQQRTRLKADTSDLLVYVLDMTRVDYETDKEILGNINQPEKTLIVANKIDLPGEFKAKAVERIRKQMELEVIAVSAATGENIECLMDRLDSLLYSESHTSGEQSVALTARQKNAINAGLQSLQAAHRCLKSPTLEHEFLALELREALDHLGSISGRIVADDVLSVIFSKFCIGK